MKAETPTRRLLRLALFTSVLIGAFAIAHHAVIHQVSTAWFIKAGLAVTVFAFIVGLVNVALVRVVDNYSQNWPVVNSRYIISYLICIALVVVVKLILESVNPGMVQDIASTEHFDGKFEIRRGIVLAIVLNTIVLLIQDLILVKEKKAGIELENAELKIRHIEATNQLLKQQIHPHFLFNSLNTLKVLIRKNPDSAENYLVKLADFLRASLVSDTPNKAKLSREIKLCYDYLEMQKMRFGDTLQFSIDIPNDVLESGYIPAFSILPLLENTIKHNVLTRERNLNIRIEYNRQWITVINNLQPKAGSQTGTGLGLSNLNDRYRLLSGEEIVVIADGAFFSVSIKVLENEDSNNRG